MRSFRTFATRWLVSALCLATLIAPLAGIVMVSGAASAQSTMEVSVVDFRNTSKIPNEMFGTMATDAVVVELLRSGKFSVTTADALQGKMEELGYKAKDDRVPKVIMTPAMMVRLGQEVGADSIVTGEITSIKVDGGKKAEAKITVRMLDVASGVWMNGAIATGASNPRIGYTADKDTDLIIEAINNAARQAVDSMVQYIIPEATIIGTFGAEAVLLNKGAQDGIQNGMEFIVLRRSETGQDEVVGRIRITDASDTDAKASIISSTRGLKPEDRIRAVFDLPKDAGANTKPGRPDTQKRIAKGSRLLWGIVALVGIAAIFKGGGAKGETVSSAVVMAGKFPDVTSVYQDGGILCMWNDPKPIRTSDIIEYHVLRDDMWSVGTQGSALTGFGPAVVADRVTAYGRTTPVGTYDHSVVDGVGWSYLTIDFSYADNDHGLATGSAKSTLPVAMGVPHTYYVSCVYGRHTTGADGADVITYWETDPVYAGIATYINRPVPEAPGGPVATEYVDLSNVMFQWIGAAGADQYVIEVSKSPDFKRNETWVDVIFQVTAQDGTLFNKSYVNVLKNADTGATVTELEGVAAGSTLFWRVGARNRTDTPGPIPAGPSVQVSGVKNTRFMYSDPSLIYSFMTLPDMPGPPPSDDGSGGGEDVPPPPL